MNFAHDMRGVRRSILDRHQKWWLSSLRCCPAGYMCSRGDRRSARVPHWSVFWVNLLLGWTIVGWIVAW